MSESHVVSGLAAKHEELAGLIEHHMQEIRCLDADLKHLDATIKLFAPDFDLRTLKVKRVPKPRMGGFKVFKPGESHRLILDALRNAERPLLTADIIGWIVQKKKLDDGPELRAVMLRTVTGSLRRLEDRGLVRGAEVGHGRALAWMLA